MDKVNAMLILNRRDIKKNGNKKKVWKALLGTILQVPVLQGAIH